MTISNGIVQAAKPTGAATLGDLTLTLHDLNQQASSLYCDADPARAARNEARAAQPASTSRTTR